MTKFSRGLIVAILFITGCVLRPVIRTQADVLNHLAGTKITTFSARGKVTYAGSQGYDQADFRCLVKGDRFRFTITGPFGILVSEVLSFGDSLYLYDAFNRILTITSPDSSLKPVIGVDIVPSEFLNTLLGALPKPGELSNYRQDKDEIALAFPSGSYFFRSRNLALVRIERPDAAVEFSDFISTAAGPRPSFIRIVAVKGQTGKERTEITIRSQEVNRPVADEVFQFSITRGIEVQDLR
jgi:outer membrane lipoprotein-sorting protein